MNLAVKYEPQAKCGRAGSARRGVQGASCPLQRVDNERKQKSKRSKQSAVRHLENKILQANCNLRNIHKQFGQRNSGEQHKGRQQSDFAEPNAGGFPKRITRTKKFFDPTIFQKCWRGSGRVALIAARRQRNPCAMLLAHGAGGEKSDSFSRRGEQDRPALFPESSKQQSCNCSGGTVTMKYYLTEILTPRENGLPHPAKGGSTPAFACQRAAIAPLPCSNLQS